MRCVNIFARQFVVSCKKPNGNICSRNSQKVSELLGLRAGIESSRAGLD
jgi:hypothetical protein